MCCAGGKRSFRALGVSKAAGAPRTYRREDVEQVVRIKHLLLVEGLTLAGARKLMEEETAPVAANAPVIDELIGRNARERLTAVKRGLRSILDLLSARRAHDFSSRRLRPLRRVARRRWRQRSAVRKRPRGKAAAGKNGRSTIGARPSRAAEAIGVLSNFFFFFIKKFLFSL